MGAGKTSVGRVLAKRLGKTFYDSDHVIEERTGVRIPVIFDIEGEEGFRAREQAVIRELTDLKNVVLATGGGAVLDAENRRMLRERGTVIYLRAAVRELINRTRHDKNRPLLQTRPTGAACCNLRTTRPLVQGGRAPCHRNGNAQHAFTGQSTRSAIGSAPGANGQPGTISHANAND